MKLRLIGVVCAALLLSACAQAPKLGSEPPRLEAQSSRAEEPVSLAIPNQDLTEQMLFEFLVAEVALQRGDYAVATSAYLGLARRTRDPRVAQRAVEVAVQGRYVDAALQAARLWREIDPESLQAQQSLAGLLVTANQLDEAYQHLSSLIARDPSKAGQSFMHLNGLLSRNPDRAAVLNLVQRLAEPYPDLPEAHFAVAQAAGSAGKRELALAESRRALELRRDWETAALLHGQLLQRESRAEALDFYKDYLRRNGDAREVRLAYARVLVSEKEYDEARKQFQRLVSDSDGNPDVIMAVGLLSLQLKDLDTAEANFKTVLDTDYRDMDAVRYYMGQVYEERKRFDEAELWYRSVGRGEQYLSAQTKVAQMLARQDRLVEGLRHLQQLQEQNPPQRAQLIMAEAQLLREAGRYQDAYDLLGRAVESNPEYPDLLYDYAMAAEKLNNLDVLEANLRKLIQLKPDHAHAYNALGYTLADRNIRLEEARDLISKALQLAPEDPFIMDSMGWVNYRMGNIDEGLGYLRRAYDIRSDPEIAAHLGELLWMKGDRAEAKRVWQTALEEHPDNEALRNTVKRFTP
jgi:tetratricopeptide (TPR) repeat protein